MNTEHDAGDDCAHDAIEIWVDQLDAEADRSMHRGRCIDCRGPLWRTRSDATWTPWSTSEPRRN